MQSNGPGFSFGAGASDSLRRVQQREQSLTASQLLLRHQLLRQQLNAASSNGNVPIGMNRSFNRQNIPLNNRNNVFSAAQNSMLRSASNGPFLPTSQDLLKASASRTMGISSAGLQANLVKQQQLQLIEQAQMRRILQANLARQKQESMMLKFQEARKRQKSPIMLTENDVLCGRGGITNSHSGNLVFRSLVRARKMSYINAPKRCDKPRIAREIVDEILNRGGRFLERCESGSWREVDDERAAKKVSQALREGAPDMRKRPNENNAETASDSRKRTRKDEKISDGDLNSTNEISEAETPGSEVVTSDAMRHDSSTPQARVPTGLDLLQAAALMKFNEED